MSEVIVITSGKGGVGKTTTSANVEGAEPEEKLSERVKTIVQDVDQLVERINREENLPKASDVVQSINEMQETERDNLELWKRVFKTDERFTKAFMLYKAETDSL